MSEFVTMMEAVPLSKILFGSDAYNVPELYWLAARWGKRYLARALGVTQQRCEKEPRFASKGLPPPGSEPPPWADDLPSNRRGG